MSVINRSDLFNPDSPVSTIEYVKNFTERTGKKIAHVVIVYEDDGKSIHVAASKSGIVSHLGILECGKNILNRWNNGEDV